MIVPGLVEAIRHLVSHLVECRYDLAAQSSGRMTESELKQAIADYGCTLVPLPAAAWALVDVVPLTADPNALSIDVPMWTREEGRSDLTLSLTATRRGDSYDIVLDDLHVL